MARNSPFLMSNETFLMALTSPKFLDRFSTVMMLLVFEDLHYSEFVYLFREDYYGQDAHY